MDLLGLRLTSRTGDRLHDQLRRAARTEPIVPPHDLLATLGVPSAESGPWRRLTLQRDVPDGDLAGVRDALFDLDVLRRLGLAVLTDTDGVEVGTTVLQRLPRVGPGLLAPCRVVRLVDTRDEVGFTYAALPRHPFAGEELFHARRHDAVLRCTVTSRSRPNAAAARFAAPVARRAQDVAARAYLRAMVRASARGTPPSTRGRVVS